MQPSYRDQAMVGDFNPGPGCDTVWKAVYQ